MTSSTSTATTPTSSASTAFTQCSALFRLFLRRQVTKGRAALFVALGFIAILSAVAIAAADMNEDRNEAVIGFVYVFGIGLMIPIISLVLASSTFGDLVEDQILVYLWHRPEPRWMLSLTAWLASISVAFPATAIPLTLAAYLGAGDATLVGPTVIGTGLAVIAYCALFVLFGLVFKRALVWGLIYLFVWELFVSRAGAGAARLSINTYASSAVAKLSEIDLPLADRSMTNALIVPLVIAAVSLALTTLRLNKTDVD